MPRKIKVVLFDDEAEDRLTLVKHGMREALRSIRADFDVEVASEDDPATAQSVLEDPAATVDVAIIDIQWRDASGDLERNFAASLVSKALERRTCVAIGMSVMADEALSYASRFERADIPHSAVGRGYFANTTGLARVLEDAFGAAGVPLRSRGVSATWEREEPCGGEAFRLAVLELACRLGFATKNLVLRPMSGRSGASTVLVTADETASFVLKLGLDRWAIVDERANFETAFVQNSGVFAHAQGEVAWFGPWYGFKLQVAAGRPAEDVLERVLAKAVWERIFDPQLVDYQVRASARFRGTCAEVLCTAPVRGVAGIEEAGKQLTLSRVERFKAAVARICDEPEVAARLLGGPSMWFASQDRLTTRTSPVHGDLHTGNVIVSSTDIPRYVDAGSILASGFWPQDVARFAVWTAVTMIDRMGGEHAGLVEALTDVLSSPDASGSQNDWTDRLSARVAETLDRYNNSWKAAGHNCDVHRDWRLAVVAELARVVYSDATFSDAALKVVAATLARVVETQPSA
jgi:hypothetical protein